MEPRTQMQRWLALAHGIDRLNLAIGRAIAWLAPIMIAIGAYNAVARYLGRSIGWNLSSNAYIELQWYLFSALFLLGAAATLADDAHVRVDVLYGRLSERAQAWINLLGTIFLMLPFCVTGLVLSWAPVRSSWRILEGSPDPGGLPRYPLKSLILVAFALLILQGFSWVVQNLDKVRPAQARSRVRPSEETT